MSILKYQIIVDRFIIDGVNFVKSSRLLVQLNPVPKQHGAHIFELCQLGLEDLIYQKKS